MLYRTYMDMLQHLLPPPYGASKQSHVYKQSHVGRQRMRTPHIGAYRCGVRVIT